MIKSPSFAVLTALCVFAGGSSNTSAFASEITSNDQSVSVVKSGKAPATGEQRLFAAGEKNAGKGNGNGGGTGNGNGGSNPGNGGSNPGNGGSNPGNGGSNPGNGGSNPGNGGSNPGNGGSNPGDGGNPGQPPETSTKAFVTWELSSNEVAEALSTEGKVAIPFHVNTRLEKTGFWLTPSLQRYLEVLTAPYGVLEPDVTYEVEVAWKEEPAEETIGGTLHLVPVNEDGNRLRRTYPVPLPIVVKVAGDEEEDDSDTESQPLTIVSNASYEGPPIAPLQIVSIYGFGIGPEEFQPAIIEDGKVTDYLADVQVLFDGTAAPIIYASSTELKVVVPSDVAGKSEVTLTVTYLGKVWEVTGIPVEDTALEIYSMNGLGHGLAMAYDSDGKPVDAENPAQPGEWITFFGTGVGLWKDGFIDGTVVDPENLPTPKKPVEVRIGGAIAKLLYVGGAPGMVNAIVQFTVVIPDELPELDEESDPAKAAIKVYSDGHPSKADLFLYIGGS